MKITNIGIVAALALGLGSEALAMPYHFAIFAKKKTSPASCVFPDGTTSKRPEIHCYNPQQFLSAYRIDRLHKMGLTGKGQTIIVVDSYGSPTLQQDLDKFSDTFGFPRTTIEFVYPNGTYINPMQTEHQVGWAGEASLDVQWAHAVAPDARIVAVISNSDEETGMSGMEDLFEGLRMATAKYPGAVVSMSFGTGEHTFTAEEAEKYLRGEFHKVVADATAAGMTVLASSGDSGSVELNLDEKSLSSVPVASYPASDPLITAVGGTALEAGWLWTPEGTADDYWDCKLAANPKCPKDFLKSVTARGNILETIWKEDWALAAGGGGVSTVFQNPGNSGTRAIPDLAFNAAVNGGVQVYMTPAPPAAGQAPSKTVWQSIGGTSAASPEVAGLVALAAQKASETLGRQVGIGALNDIIYALPSRDFNDIVPHQFGTEKQVAIESNALYYNASVLSKLGPTAIPPVPVPGFPVMQGYDMATGLGSPKAVRFVLDVARARVAQTVPGGVIQSSMP